ncbi:fibrocystin-L-like [Amphiura filiformis]|uniref:fibrocystin-L-like n=1 Tax=Amphiura filiformis TaxID=82378 RepID=UPI003B225820
MCNLTDPETGDLYGIAPISEGNQWVIMKVKPAGKVIGSQKFNFSIVSSNLGLGSSMNLPKSLRVSGKNELYHYQTHAVITSVEPTHGSLEGGTLLTITGNYFANRGYRTPARVSVGGVPCVVKNVSDTEIKCVTGKAAENSTNKYPGSRGLIFDKWDTRFSFEDEKWTTTSPALSKHVIEGSTPLDNITLGDYYCGRLRGYFVPPKDGEYRLAIRGNDVSQLFFSETGDPANMTKVAEGIRYTEWDWHHFPEQISEKFNLTADKPYPIEARYCEYRGQDWVQFGYERYDVPFVSTDLEGAVNEQQSIFVKSDEALEIQSLFIEGAKEVQQVTVAYTGCENSIHSYTVIVDCDETTHDNCDSGTVEEVLVKLVDCKISGSFRLTYDGQETAPIAISASAGEVEVELGKLSSLSAIQHSVTAESDGVITRTFNVTFDVYEDLSLMTVSVSDADNMAASVTEISPGTTIKDDEPFTFSYGGKESQALTLGSSALEVQDALLDLFSIKCVQPQQSGLFFSDFENQPTGKLTGKRVIDEEPFCGRTSLKNPSKIYEAGEIRDSAKRNPGPFSFGMADKVHNNWHRQPAANLNGIMVADVHVTKSVSTFTITMTPAKCGHNFPLIGIQGAQIHSGSDNANSNKVKYLKRNSESAVLFNVERLETASPPVMGYFTLEWNGKLVKAPANADAKKMKKEIERLGTGIVAVVRSGQCSGYTWDVEWTSRGGRQPLIQVDGSEMSGNNVGVSVSRRQGGAYLGLVPGEFLRLMYDIPQVEVFINEIPSLCNATCAFTQSEVFTPTVTAVTPFQGNDGTSITISGSGFSTTMVDNQVKIGGVGCDVTSASETSIECTVGKGAAGSNKVVVNVSPDGLASHSDECTVGKGAAGSNKVVVNVSPDGLASHSDECSIGKGAAGSNKVVVNESPDGLASHSDECTVGEGAAGSNKVVVNVSPDGLASHSDDGLASHSDECTVGEGAAGSNKVVVNVSPDGLASHSDGDVMFEYTGDITDVSPPSGSTAGGTELTVTGYGFCSCNSDVPEDMKESIKVDGHNCIIMYITYDQIMCTIVKIQGAPVSRKKRATTTGSVVIITNSYGNTLTSEGSYTYSSSLTPDITAMAPSSSSVLGGGSLELTGTGFATSGNKVTLSGIECVITAETATQINCNIPAHTPGQYNIELSVPGKGFADTSQVGKFTFKLKVTGVSPDTGSVLGGTMVTISGEGFGTNSSLVKVKFGSAECEITTPLTGEQIVCVTKRALQKHRISNQGIHEEFGIGYRWNPDEIGIMVGETVCWWWSVPAAVVGKNFTVYQTACADDDVYDGVGFNAGRPTPKGSYCFTFNGPGTFYYSSEAIEVGMGELYMKGTINVKDNGIAEKVDVMVGDYSVEHDMSQTVVVAPAGDCTPDTSLMSSCSTTPPSPDNSQLFNFKFDTCSTPVIESVTPNWGDSNTQIEIRGVGFGDNIGQNEVKVGDHTCQPTSASSTLIICNILTESTPVVGFTQFVSLIVANRGLAIYNGTDAASYTFTLLPMITSLSPIEGSVEGGTQITISGDGFSTDGSIVRIAGSICVITSVTYTQIICTTSKAVASGTYSVSLNINGATGTCPNDCDFNFSAAMTSTISDVNPKVVSGATTGITISGSRFTNIIGDVTVTIGGVDCVVSAASDAEIVCSVGYVPVGSAMMTVNISPIGVASFTDSSHKNILSSNDIFSVTPGIGSKKGGQGVTILGNGFHSDSTLVTIADKPCKIISITISEVKCITPAKGTSGQFPLKVTSGIHSYVEKVYNYSYLYTPRVDSVTPAYGKSGDSVTIEGARFNAAMSEITVTIDGVECAVSSSTLSSIVCAVGVHSAGTYLVDVHVKGMGYASSAVQFEYELSITNTMPSTGSFGGGRTLRIDGIGFGDAATTTVYVCDNICPILSITATSIECDVPANSDTADRPTLDCDIMVKLASQAQQVSSSAWQYRRDMTPTITSVLPKRGGTGGGTTLTIKGTDFSLTGNKVSIAGTVCEVQMESTTEITCLTGEHSETIKTKVRVEVSNKGIATQDYADYYYVDRWSSQYTWGGKDPPVKGDFVIIKAGQTVLLDQDTPVLKMVLIQGGCLIFDDEQASITLKAEYILIVDGGCLQIGTEEEPYLNKATIMMHGHVLSKELPLYGAKTIAVRNGTLDLHGKPVPVTWTHLARTIKAGDMKMTLEQAVTWNVNDKIVIASTGDRHSQRENEELTITAVSGDGMTLDFEPAVQYDHISMMQIINGVSLETRAEVGLLTRNVVVRGSVHSEWTETIELCEAEFDTGQFSTQTCFEGRYGREISSDQFGVQIMLFAKEADSHLSTGRIEYVEVTHAGQAFRLGRYPIHFHLNGNVTGNYVRGCSIHDTFNRAVTIHGVHNLLIEHNVAYNIMGHAYFLEDGIETNNIIQYNLAIFVRPSSSLLNVDVTPAAFWITNPDNIVRHNAAAGCSHFGFWYNAPKNPGGLSFRNKVCPRNIPVLEFRNNSAHSLGWYGLWIFPEYYPKEGGGCSSSSTSAPAEFHNLTAWHVERGAEAVEVGAVRLINFLISDATAAGLEYQTSWDAWGGPLIQNSIIIGHSDIAVSDSSCTEAGVQLPKSRHLTIDGVKFMNFDRDGCAAVRACSHCKVDQGGFQSRFQNIEYYNSPNKARWKWQHECWLEDLDGTLLGESANYKLLPYNPNLPADHCNWGNSQFGSSNLPGAVCDETMTFHRLAFNNPLPISLKFKRTVFVNDNGASYINYHKKRLTHPDGWMVTLIDGDNYRWFFEDRDHLTNISYDARFEEFSDGDFILMNHNLTQKPDVFVITGDLRNGTVAVPSYDADNNGDWSFDNSTKVFTYLISGKGESIKPRDFNIALDVYQYYSDNCIQPQVPQVPTDERPETYILWSDTNSWPNSVPSDGADVTIKAGVWMVADTDLPKMGKLFIYGTLELDPTRDFVLDAVQILIQGGHFIAGWKDQPFTRNGKIILRGRHSTPEIVLPSGPVLGSKALGVFGGLDLHGISRTVYWTHLASTIFPGDNTITVVKDTDWKVGDEIVIATTSYDPWHTETFAIAAVNGRTFTLNATVQYKHLGATYTVSQGSINSYSMRAEVGLFTRNLKIEGAYYSDLFEESFGARVLVSTFSQDGCEYKGYARISNVEFYHSGQEGHIDSYDPRYSLAFLNTGEVNEVYPSFVRGCSFHHGFSTAIGLFGVDGITLEDNVIHHVVGAGVRDEGNNNRMVHNLVALVIFSGMYQGRFEAENLFWCGGFEVQVASKPVLIDNSVAGSERIGFKIKGEQCLLGGDVPDPDTAWRGNVAHGALHGIHIYPESQPVCSLISNFVLYRNYDYGIYIQVDSSVVISDTVLVDNHVGMLSLIHGPKALSHLTSDKSLQVKNSLIVGFSPDFECGVDDDVTPAIASHPKSHSNKVKSPDGGHAGFVFNTFASGRNGAPFKPFHGVMNYPALSGFSDIVNVVFSNFGNTCSKRSFMFMTNPASGDFMHPIHTKGIGLDNVDLESLFFFHRPDLGLVNPADCVDMDCDAMKKALIRDLDGSLLGSVGTVVPQSQFEWDGDPRRGLGDYRIPKTMLTAPDGSRINAKDKCPKKGIYGVHDSGCTWQSTGQAYKCLGMDHMIMIFESLDADTELRRLSPVALYSDQYLDVINGPQDHGWCNGYTCQERISTFYTMVATGKEYGVYFSSINPQRMRLHLLNAVITQKVVVGIYYANPQRLDVYVNGLYIMPTNGKLNENGDFVLENDPHKRSTYKPSVTSNVTGMNYFDRDHSTLYILVCGSDPVDIITTPVVVVSFDVPAVSVDDFFEENLIQNLVAFLGVKRSQIRIIEIMAVNSRRLRSVYHFERFRRATDTVEVIFEVGDPPADSIVTDGDADVTHATMATPVDLLMEMRATKELPSLSVEQLEEVGSKLADSMQQGELEEAINVPVVSMTMTDPEPTPEDPTGGVHATNETGGPANGSERFDEQQTEHPEDEHVAVVYRIPSVLVIHMEASGASEREPFSVQPKIKVLDGVVFVPSVLVIHMEASGASEREPFSVQPKIKVLDGVDVLVEQLGHHSNPWQLAATLRHGNGNPDAQLLGSTTVPFKKGFANFLDLAIDKMGSGYTLDFAIIHPNSSTLAIDSSVEISITKREYYAVVASTPSLAYVDEEFAVIVELKDVLTDRFPQGLTDKGYTWKASASLLMPSNYHGSLDGTMEVTFDMNTAQAHFQDLSINAKGYLYIIQFHVYTIPSSDYDFTVNSEGFDVKFRGQIAHSGDSKTFTICFDEDYDTVARGNEGLLKINFFNKVSPMYPYATFSNVLISEGSILITFDVQGDVVSTQNQMLEDLSNGMITLSFNGYTLSADNYLQVDGKEVKAGKSTALFAPWLIAVIVIIAMLMLLITASAVYWLCFLKRCGFLGQFGCSLCHKHDKQAYCSPGYQSKDRPRHTIKMLSTQWST